MADDGVGQLESTGLDLEDLSSNASSGTRQ